MSEWFDCLIGFGANLGNPLAGFEQTRDELASANGIRKLVASSPIRTQPVGGPGQPQYLNGVFRLQTNRSATLLHELLASFEQRAGRERIGRWQPRSLDLDLLLYGTETIRTNTLQVPHPRMTVRRFVLEPAAEIAGDMVHPLASVNLQQLLDRLNRGPNQLLWVTVEHGIAEKVVAGVKRQLERSSTSRNSAGLDSWTVVRAGDLAMFHSLQSTAKIVVWSSPRPQDLLEARFAGPQIELPERNWSADRRNDEETSEADTIAEFQAELLASIEAANG